MGKIKIKKFKKIRSKRPRLHLNRTQLTGIVGLVVLLLGGIYIYSVNSFKADSNTTSQTKTVKPTDLSVDEVNALNNALAKASKDWVAFLSDSTGADVRSRQERLNYAFKLVDKKNKAYQDELNKVSNKVVPATTHWAVVNNAVNMFNPSKKVYDVVPDSSPEVDNLKQQDSWDVLINAARKPRTGECKSKGMLDAFTTKSCWTTKDLDKLYNTYWPDKKGANRNYENFTGNEKDLLEKTYRALQDALLFQRMEPSKEELQKEANQARFNDDLGFMMVLLPVDALITVPLKFVVKGISAKIGAELAGTSLDWMTTEISIARSGKIGFAINTLTTADKARMAALQKEVALEDISGQFIVNKVEKNGIRISRDGASTQLKREMVESASTQAEKKAILKKLYPKAAEKTTQKAATSTEGKSFTDNLLHKNDPLQIPADSSGWVSVSDGYYSLRAVKLTDIYTQVRVGSTFGAKWTLEANLSRMFADSTITNPATQKKIVQQMASALWKMSKDPHLSAYFTQAKAQEIMSKTFIAPKLCTCGREVAGWAKWDGSEIALSEKYTIKQYGTVARTFTHEALHAANVQSAAYGRIGYSSCLKYSPVEEGVTETITRWFISGRGTYDAEASVAQTLYQAYVKKFGLTKGRQAFIDMDFKYGLVSMDRTLNSPGLHSKLVSYMDAGNYSGAIDYIKSLKIK